MKVLRIINSPAIGGAERSILESADGLEKLGHEIDVFFLLNGNGGFKRQYEKRFTSVYSPRHSRLLELFRLINICRKYNLIHIHLFPGFYIGILIRLVYPRKLIVYTEHSTQNRRQKSLLRHFDRHVYRFYDGIFCISQGVYSVLNNYGVNQSKLFLLENAVNIDRIVQESSEAPPFIRQPGFTYIGMIAQFRVEKDHFTLIRAIETLTPKHVLVLAGKGDTLDDCKLLVNQLELDDRVIFLGEVNNTSSVISILDLCVLSSHWEGFGRSIVEAMSLGKPVVASDVSGLSDVVRPIGSLFQPLDVLGLRAAIEYELSRPNSYNKSLIDYATKFDIKSHCARYDSIIRKLKVK